jgi:hypothetical protein
VARPEQGTTSILFIFGLLTKWYFLLLLLVLVLLSLGWCCWLCHATGFAACPAIIAHMTRGIQITMALFFALLAISFFTCFVVDPTFILGDLGHEFAWFA